MGRIFGLDYGDKKIGVAISDEDHEFAVPFQIIINEGRSKTLAAIDELAKQEEIETIVVGLPIPLSADQPITDQQLKKTQNFIEALKSLPYQIMTEDERLTTQMAQRLMVRKQSGEDDVAAMLILQTYLDKLKN